MKSRKKVMGLTVMAGIAWALAAGAAEVKRYNCGVEEKDQAEAWTAAPGCDPATDPNHCARAGRGRAGNADATHVNGGSNQAPAGDSDGDSTQ